MDLDLTSIYAILITIITVFGSAGAWRFYEKRASSKEKIENFMKTNYEERIKVLESHLNNSSLEKNDLRDKVLTLTSEVSKLKVKVEFLEKENKALSLMRGLNKGN